MLRTSIVKLARPSLVSSRATIMTSARMMSEGDTGSPPKAGGQGYVLNSMYLPEH